MAIARRSDRRLHFAWVDTDAMDEGSVGQQEVHMKKLREWYSEALGKSNDWKVLACRPTKAKGSFFVEDDVKSEETVNFEKVERWIDGLMDGATSLKKMGQDS